MKVIKKIGNHLVAMQEILKYEYLEENFVFDEILEKKYGLSKTGIRAFCNDYVKLGLICKEYGLTSSICNQLSELIKKNPKVIVDNKISMQKIIELLCYQYTIYDNYYEIMHVQADNNPALLFDDFLEPDFPDLVVMFTNVLYYYQQYIETKRRKEIRNQNHIKQLRYFKNK